MKMIPQQTGALDLPAEYQVLLHSISSCAGPAVEKLVTLDPKLLHIKGWHGLTALHKACLGGDTALVEILLKAGADPNAKNDFDETPLHYACKRGVPSIVQVLMNYGGDLTLKDRNERGPVHHASQTGSVIMLHYLAMQNLSFTDEDVNKQTALHIVCGFGHLDAFKYLMRKGRCDPSLPDGEGNTPLHICAREGYQHGSWILLRRLGMSALQTKNHKGCTPLDLARQHDKYQTRKVVELFERLLLGKESLLGPTYLWYWWLLVCGVVYMLCIIIALFVGHGYQGFVFLVGLGYLLKQIITSSHRLDHVCRWPSPFYAGMFAAGTFHTMLVYYVAIAQYNNYLVVLFSAFVNAIQLYLYWKVLRMDPGVVQSSVFNDETRQPTTLIDICTRQENIKMFCIECEIVTTKDTKHCKLCDQCFYRMDHHCLYLLKCVAHKNHAVFVWFISAVTVNMILFILQVFYYCHSYYESMTFWRIVGTMFNNDAWVLSMFLMNLVCIIWSVNLCRSQLYLASRGQTQYFTRKETEFSSLERLKNLVIFLQRKPGYKIDSVIHQV
ncbi:hypothetical protein ACJMK2_034447 [Sinanodonta woodiana]|uniref:Palmitoyltransferase n=1 Tax=Sinanodonta woodiana TaxID=1069815 RepID=A0ABD3WRM2_SINWO